MASLDAFRELLSSADYYVVDENRRRTLTFSSKIGQSLIREFFPELNESLALSENGEIADQYLSDRLEAHFRRLIALLANDSGEVRNKFRKFKQSDEFAEHLRCYYQTQLSKTLGSAEVLAGQSRDPYEYIVDRVAQIHDLEKSEVALGPFGFKGKALSSLKFNKSKPDVQIIASNRILGLNPAVSFWFKYQELIPSGLDVQPILVREEGEPNLWVEIGAIKIPTSFVSVFEEMDEMLLDVLNNKRLSRRHSIKKYALFTKYSMKRKKKFPISEKMYADNTLSMMADVIYGKGIGKEKGFTFDEVFQGLQIYFNHVNSSAVALYDVRNDLYIIPDSYTVMPSLGRDGKFIQSLRYSEYFSALVKQDDYDGRQRLTRFSEYVSGYFKKYYPGQTFKAHIESEGLPLTTYHDVVSLSQRYFSGIDKTAKVLKGNIAKFYWERYGDELSQYFDILEVLVPERIDGCKGCRLINTGAIKLDFELEPMYQKLNSALILAMQKLKRENPLYMVIKRCINGNTKSALRKDNFSKVVQVLMEKTSLGDYYSNRQIEQALRLKMNFVRIMEYLPIFAPGNNIIHIPESMNWFEFEGGRRYRRKGDNGKSLIVQKNNPVKYWSKFKKEIVEHGFEVRNGLEVDLNGQTKPASAIVFPEVFKDDFVDVLRGVIRFSKTSHSKKISKRATEILNALMLGADLNLTSDDIDYLAKWIHKSQSNGKRIDEKDWRTALMLYGDYNGLMSSMPVIAKNKRYLFLPKNIVLKKGYKDYTNLTADYLHEKLNKLRITAIITGNVKAELSSILSLYSHEQILEQINKMLKREVSNLDHELVFHFLVKLMASASLHQISEIEIITTLCRLMWKDSRYDKYEIYPKGISLLRKLGYTKFQSIELSDYRWDNIMKMSDSEIMQRLEKLKADVEPRGTVSGFILEEGEYADFLRKKEEKRKKRKAQIPVSDQKIDYNGMPVGSEAKIPSTLMMPLDVLIK